MIKYASCVLLLVCGSIVINGHVRFINFTQSVRDGYSILWVLSSFFIQICLLSNKNKIYKLQKQILVPNQKLTKFSNPYFLTYSFLEIIFFTFESYYLTTTTRKFYYNPQIYPLFTVFLHDVMSTDFVNLYKNEIEKIEHKISKNKTSLQNLSKYHNNLIDSFENMTEIFALSRLCSVSISFVTLVFSFYFTFEKASNVPWPIAGMFWISLYSTKLCYMAYANVDLNLKVILNIDTTSC